MFIPISKIVEWARASVGIWYRSLTVQTHWCPLDISLLNVAVRMFYWKPLATVFISY